ncbi:MAG: protein kinase [Myxococcales bacterium]
MVDPLSKGPEAPPADPADLRTTLASSEQRRQPLLPRGAAVGRYFVLDLLGEGGMGTVYSAYDPELDRKVAIKLLKLGDETPETARARLQREAQAMARLSHENVLSVFDVGVHQQALFLAMELVEGTTLRDWLAAKKRAPREALALLLAAGEGLAAAHAAGLVHRDFKPENVLVDRTGRVRVTDFGTARVVEERPSPEPAMAAALAPFAAGPISGSVPTVAGAIVGTPAYMAPEQLAGGATDARSDQFAFCVALWEALVGERPFAGLDLQALRHAVLVAPPPAPPRSLPFHLRRALARGLSRRPEDRFASMAELLAALRRDPVARAGRAALALVAACAALGLPAYLAWQWREEETRCQRESQEARRTLFPLHRRDQLAGALARAGVDPRDQAAAGEALEGGLDLWQRSRQDGCEGARRGAPPPSEATDCLEDYALRFDATVQLLSEPGVDARAYLGAALEQLGRPDGCLRPSAQRRPAVTEERRRFFAAASQRMDVLNALGRAAQVVADAPALVRDARAAGAQAQASLIGQSLGWALWNHEGPGEAAEQVLRQAILDADEAGDDRASLTARLTLLNFFTIGAGEAQKAQPVAQQTAAWLRRLGTPEDLEQAVVPALAALESLQDHGAESLRLYRRGIEVATSNHGPDSPLVASSRNDLATELERQGRHREALAEYQQVAAALERAHFVEPTTLALAWGNMASAHMALGELARAEQALARAEAVVAPIREGTYSFALWVDLLRAALLVEQGEPARAEALYVPCLERREQLDVVTLGFALYGRAEALTALGRHAEAIPLAEESIALADRTSDRPGRGHARFALARALRGAGQDEPRAIALARQAILDLQGPEESYQRSKVETWLRQIGAAGRDAR